MKLDKSFKLDRDPSNYEALTHLIQRMKERDFLECDNITEAIEDVIDWYHEGVSYDGAVGRIHDRWDEKSFYGWLHTISNAQIVAVGLLWGEDDFEQSIGRAVQAAFDTDCNGATVGSILGMVHGADSLPDEWVDPLNDTVETSLVDYPRENISDLAQQTLELHEKYT